MIPWLLKVHIGRPNKKDRKLWLPLPLIYIPVFILALGLSPLLIIAATVLLIIRGINMFKALPAIFRVVEASSGFLIDIDTPKEKFLIAIK